jgi:hypothetical protein
MAEVIVTIKKDGTATVHANGVVGPSCTTHTRPFLVLGKEVGQHALPEMFQEVQNEAQNRVSQ